MLPNNSINTANCTKSLALVYPVFHAFDISSRPSIFMLGFNISFILNTAILLQLLHFNIYRTPDRASVAAKSINLYASMAVWHNGLVVSALGIRTQGPRFDSRVAPLFHWVATLGKLLTHIASAVSQLQETGDVQKGSFSAPRWLR